VGGLANRMIELKPDGSVTDFTGTYDEYLEAQGLES
jgi:ATPase subunit of ABC transporter with duplicated ATPase domains